MKLVLSRKGFDSAAGGVASPIFPDGTMYSLPIRAEGARTPYGRIRKGDPSAGMDVGTVVEQLTARRGKPAPTTRDAPAHLGPDLDHGALPRLTGWRPCFGQTGAAQGHLAERGVGEGDLFLFFGWFRQVVRSASGRWDYRPSAPDLHVLFGWLQVGRVLHVETISAPAVAARFPWLREHPHLHFVRPAYRTHNTIYVAADRLVLTGVGDTGLPGGGEANTFSDRLVLTDPASPNRSRWRLPSWFAAGPGRPALSCNESPSRWTADGACAVLDAAPRGQEFVLDCVARPECAAWVLEKLRPPTHAGRRVA
jgi:hypothetical protein